jgi:hypothetical protein
VSRFLYLSEKISYFVRNFRRIHFASTSLLGVIAFASTNTSVAEQPKRAASFVDSIGIAGHLQKRDDGLRFETHYKKFFANTKIKHFRTGLRHVGSPNPDLDIQLDELTKAPFNVKIMGNVGSPDTAITTLMEEAIVPLAPYLTYLEGPNEPNAPESGETWNAYPPLSTHNDWREGVTQYQDDLYKAVDADSRTTHVEVSCFPLSGSTMTAEANNFGPLNSRSNKYFCNFVRGNGHPYPAFGYKPSACLDGIVTNPGGNSKGDFVRKYNTMFPGTDRNWIATEAGYNNGKSYPAVAVPTWVSARYIPRLLLEMFNRKFKRVYIYNLYDSGVDNQFGLLTSAAQYKTAFYAVKYLTDLVDDGTNTGFTVTNLDYTTSPSISNDTAANSTSLRHLLLQKKDGRYYLIIWNDVSSYDTSKTSKTPVDDWTIKSLPVDVNLDLSKTAREVKIWDTLTVAVGGESGTTGPKLRRTLPNAKTFNVTVPDYPVVVEIKP